jgi:hypothetical protein
MWTMDGNGGSVAYFIMDGERKKKVSGKDTSLRELARSNRKTRANGQRAKIGRAEEALFVIRQSGMAHDIGVECDRRLFYAFLSKGVELAFSSVRTLLVYKRTLAALGKSCWKHRNEAGFCLDLCQAHAARFVSDLTSNWGSEYMNSKDTCNGAPISDSSLVVLSGPFKHIVNKEPANSAWIEPRRTTTAVVGLISAHSTTWGKVCRCFRSLTRLPVQKTREMKETERGVKDGADG